MLRMRYVWLLLVLMGGNLMVSTPLHAQDDTEDAAEAEDEEVSAEPAAEGEEGALAGGSIYLPLKPPFVVNYGGPGPLRFLKADITVRLQDAQIANSVRHHMPYIRNNLVMLFSAQTEESISSQDGKEALRQEALAEVRNVVMQEDQIEGVVDLYFNTILVQR